VECPDGNVVTYTYNALGQMASVADWLGSSGGTTDFTYDSAGSLATVTPPNGTVSTYSYESDENMNRIAAGLVASGHLLPCQGEFPRSQSRLDRQRQGSGRGLGAVRAVLARTRSAGTEAFCCHPMSRSSVRRWDRPTSMKDFGQSAEFLGCRRCRTSARGVDARRVAAPLCQGGSHVHPPGPAKAKQPWPQPTPVLAGRARPTPCRPQVRRFCAFAARNHTGECPMPAPVLPLVADWPA